MDRARQILLTSKKPIIEVALDVGFVNTSHFTNEFRRSYGRTPAEIRNAAARDRAAPDHAQQGRHQGGPEPAVV
ncbi:helix-turn-helix domain-containing protein [Sinorhizobium saheli]|nr:helix-turn-helix domain-containing protein [Sinorhizobium saheli]